MELEYFVVDVFTETALKGNPLAVVMNTAALTTEQMQAIAREFNLSETTFVERRAVEVEQRRRRARADLHHAGGAQLRRPSDAGHGQRVENAMHRIRDAGDMVTWPSMWARFPCASAGEGLFGEMTQRIPSSAPSSTVGSGAADQASKPRIFDPALPPQVVSTGTAFRHRRVALCRSLGALRVDQQQATAWLRERGARWFYVLGPTESTHSERGPSGARACSSTAAKIPRLVPPPVARSATWWRAAQ